MVVDDEAEIRGLLSDILTMKGYEVATASSVDEARRLFKSNPPDLLISDFQMKDADGFVLIDEIKTEHPDLPIMLLTGASFDTQVVQETIRKKVSSYLDKTASLETVLSEIERMLRTREPVS